MFYRSSKINATSNYNLEKRRLGKIVPICKNEHDMSCGICGNASLKECEICKRNLCLSCTIRSKYCMYCYRNESSNSAIKAIRNHEIEIRKKTCSSHIYNLVKKIL